MKDSSYCGERTASELPKPANARSGEIALWKVVQHRCRAGKGHGFKRDDKGNPHGTGSPAHGTATMPPLETFEEEFALRLLDENEPVHQTEGRRHAL
jgi:hypothetical protein